MRRIALTPSRTGDSAKKESRDIRASVLEQQLKGTAFYFGREASWRRSSDLSDIAVCLKITADGSLHISWPNGSADWLTLETIRSQMTIQKFILGSNSLQGLLFAFSPSSRCHPIDIFQSEPVKTFTLLPTSFKKVPPTDRKLYGHWGEPYFLWYPYFQDLPRHLVIADFDNFWQEVRRAAQKKSSRLLTFWKLSGALSCPIGRSAKLYYL